MARQLQAKPWWFPALAGAFALACLIAGSRTLLTTVAVLVAVSLTPAAVVAHRREWITRRVLLGIVSFSLANATVAILRTASLDHPRARVWAEFLALIAAGMIIFAVGLVARNRRGSDFWGVMADGGIVALGGWLLAWVTLVRAGLDHFDRHPWLTIAESAFTPLGSIIVFLLIVVVFSNTMRTHAVIHLTIAVVLALLGGLIRALQSSGQLGQQPMLASCLTIVAFGFALSAILHPSVATLIDNQPENEPRPLFGRVMVTTTALVVPIVVMSAISPHSGTDRLVRTLSVGVLATMVIIRIVQALQANRAAQDELLRGAQTDPLTGLPNRGLLLEHINNTLRESWKGSDHPTVFFIDLDRFKNINDSLGHAAGDRVLCTIADRLRLTVPERTTVARISGDEYVVFDPSSPSLTAAMDLADSLLAQFSEAIPLSHGDVFVTASIGVARSEPQSHRTADVLLRHADTAMYQAKDAGRNCVAMFDESMHERVAHRLTVETALFRALDRRELRLYYQPILEVTTGDVVGFEALMRWQQADGTIVSPVEFIPIAEETGVINQIGAWALNEALNQMHAWMADGVCSQTANMSVNVSPRQLADPTFPAIVHDALLSSQVSPNQLWLEVTEGIMITEPELALATLRRLRSLGVRVALDDFGTGYSSLSLLQKFPLQRIKIDRAFVRGVADNANDRSLVRTIIAMGSSLGLDMVAEGVETVQQLQVLSELGCSKAQGYLISHPVPPDAMRSTVSALERMGPWPGVGRQREVFALPQPELTA